MLLHQSGPSQGQIRGYIFGLLPQVPRQNRQMVHLVFWDCFGSSSVLLLEVQLLCVQASIFRGSSVFLVLQVGPTTAWGDCKNYPILFSFPRK